MPIRIINFPEGLITRPERYIGKKSIDCLQAFYNGCAFTESKNKCESIFEIDFNEFEAWVDNKEECLCIKNRSEISSFEQAALICDDEDTAFDLWISWYKEFKNISKEYFDKKWEEEELKYYKESGEDPSLY